METGRKIPGRLASGEARNSNEITQTKGFTQKDKNRGNQCIQISIFAKRLEMRRASKNKDGTDVL